MTTRDRYPLRPRAPEPPPPPVEPEPEAPPAATGRYVKLALLALLLTLVVWGGLKAWRLGQAARSLMALQGEAETLAQGGLAGLDADAVEDLLLRARADIVTLRDETRFTRPIAPHLGWVPRVGPLLVASPYLVDMADGGSEAAVLAVGSLKPMVPVVQREDFGTGSLGEVLPTLTAAAPALEEAGAALDRAAAARAELAGAIPSEQLPWRVRQLLELADRWLPIGQDGLRLAPHLPALLGANGPKRYLIMAQNEDELRATGGFITGAGIVSVENGRISDLAFRDSSDVDNFAARPYDAPPRPLQEFMGLDLFAFRDTNYWADFPTSAQKALDLYAYGLDVPPLDGAIAIDQEFLRLLVDATGPVPIPGSDANIDADNLLQVLRQARNIQEGQEVGEWVANRKAFLGGFAAAILTQIESDFGAIDPVKLITNMVGAAESRHLSIYMRDPDVAAALAATGWDGRLPSAPPGDFMMAVDTNVGYNKVNVHIERSYTFNVTLGPEPQASLMILYRHTGQAQSGEPCLQGVDEEFELALPYESLTDKCYWNYLRVYVPAGSVLRASSEHLVPGETILSGRTWQNAAEPVSEQPGLATWANFLMVPRASEETALFEYDLPAGVVQTEDGIEVYRLTVFKQPGTRPESLVIIATLPPGATLLSASHPAELDGDQIMIGTMLSTHAVITLRYRLP